MGSVIRQVLFTFIICTIGINFGIMYVWPSSTVKLFSSANTTLHRPMTETEIALFGSLSSVAALVSTPLSGFLLDILGRKCVLILFSLPQVLSWSIVLLSNRVELVLVAAFLSGSGGAFFTICHIYIGEICQTSIRGALTACSNILFGLGMLLSYILGGILTYEGMKTACLTISITGVMLMTLLKETPTFLLVKGLEEEATRAVAFYKGVKLNSKEVTEEILNINKYLNTVISPEEEILTMTNETRSAEKLSVIQFLKQSKSTREGFKLSLPLCGLAVFQGLVVAQVYAEPLYGEALPHVSGTVCSIASAVLVAIVGIIAGYLTDVCGRRPLMIYCSLATGVCCVLLGTQIHLHWGPHWMTAVFLYAYYGFFTAGAGTIPYVVNAEFFLPEIRSFISTAVLECAWICNFILLFLFNPLVEAIGLGPVFYIFAVVCFIAAIFSYFYLPETKGLPVDVIQTLLTKKHQLNRYF